MRKPCIHPPCPVYMSDTNTLLPNGKGVWIPVDHGVSDFPVQGLENLDNLIQSIAHADAIVAQKGVVSHYSTMANFVCHLSASTRHAGARSSDKVLVGSVEESLSRGAKGVSVQVNMGSDDEPDMIERLGLITQDAHYLNCPVLGMIYPRGPNLSVMEGDDTEAVAEQTTADKADDADRNYRHIELMKEKDWFWNTATTAQKSTFNDAISAGKAYYDANS